MDAFVLKKVRRIFHLMLAAIVAVAFLGCSSVIRKDNEIIFYSPESLSFGSLPINYILAGMRTTKEELAQIGDEIDAFLRAFDREITTALSEDGEQSAVRCFNEDIGGKDWPNPKASGAWVRYPIGKHALAMLERAQTYFEDTDGLFDPTVFAMMQLWGLETGAWTDAGRHGNVESFPNPTAVAEKLAHTGFENIAFGEDADGCFVAKRKENPKLMLDFGAQAKGYAADRVRDIVKKYEKKVTSAFIDLAGNLALIGGCPDYVDYKDKHYLKGMIDFNIGITDPYSFKPMKSPDAPARKEKPIVGIPHRDISAVTSGVYARRFFWSADGFSLERPTLNAATYFCHIIDPKTGFPCNIDKNSYDAESRTQPYRNIAADRLASATIFHTSSETADVAATAVMLMGMTDGVAWMKARGLCGVLLGEDKKYATVGLDTVSKDPSKYSFLEYGLTARGA